VYCFVGPVVLLFLPFLRFGERASGCLVFVLLCLCAVSECWVRGRERGLTRSPPSSSFCSDTHRTDFAHIHTHTRVLDRCALPGRRTAGYNIICRCQNVSPYSTLCCFLPPFSFFFFFFSSSLDYVCVHTDYAVSVVLPLSFPYDCLCTYTCQKCHYLCFLLPLPFAPFFT